MKAAGLGNVDGCEEFQDSGFPLEQTAYVDNGQPHIGGQVVQFSDLLQRAGGEVSLSSAPNVSPTPLTVTEEEIVCRAVQDSGAAIEQAGQQSSGVAAMVRDALSWQRKDRLLFRGLPELVSSLDLASLLVLQPDRKAPKNIDDYRLISVTALNPDPSSTSPGRFIKMPNGVKTNYRKIGGQPYLDSGLAVGLVYRDELTAVAAASFNKCGSLQICQLQGVATAPAGRSRRSAGLNGGFYWRDTLVNAWLQVAHDIGVDDVEILGAANNVWADGPGSESFERYVKGYDEVAERMGFTQNEQSGNWEISLDR